MNVQGVKSRDLIIIEAFEDMIVQNNSTLYTSTFLKQLKPLTNTNYCGLKNTQLQIYYGLKNLQTMKNPLDLMNFFHVHIFFATKSMFSTINSAHGSNDYFDATMLFQLLCCGGKLIFVVYP